MLKDKNCYGNTVKKMKKTILTVILSSENACFRHNLDPVLVAICEKRATFLYHNIFKHYFNT